MMIHSKELVYMLACSKILDGTKNTSNIVDIGSQPMKGVMSLFCSLTINNSGINMIQCK